MCCLHPCPSLFLPEYQERSRDEVRRVGSNEGPEDQRQDEPADALGTEEEDGEEHDECAKTGAERPLQRLLKTALHEFPEVALRPCLDCVIADAIQNDDNVVHGVAHDTQKGCHKEAIDLERREGREDGEDADEDEDRVERRENGNDTEAEGAEFPWDLPEGDCEVEDDREGGYPECEERSLLERCRDARTDGREFEFLDLSEGLLQMGKELHMFLIREQAHAKEVRASVLLLHTEHGDIVEGNCACRSEGSECRG